MFDTRALSVVRYPRVQYHPRTCGCDASATKHLHVFSPYASISACSQTAPSLACTSISASPAPHLVFRFVNNTLTCISHSPSRVHRTPAGLSSARRIVQGRALPGYTLRKAISQTCQRSASTVDHPRRSTVCTDNIKMHNIFSKLKRAAIRSIRSKETTKS